MFSFTAWRRKWPTPCDAFSASVVAGRALHDGDSTGSTPAIVVNRAFLNQLLGGANAVGRQVHYVQSSGRGQAAGSTPTEALRAE